MARTALVQWYNPVSQKLEWVTGVDCACYECRWDAQFSTPRDEDGDFYDGQPFTKAEYRVHQRERATAYAKYQEIKNIRNEERKAAHTKETEAPGRHGRLPGVPTFFDVKTGGKAYADDLTNPGASWSRLWRASVKKD